MKQLAHAEIIALLQTRAKLQEMCNGATTDTIKIGDDIKHQIELPGCAVATGQRHHRQPGRAAGRGTG